MPTYFYTAKTLEGKTETGERIATDEQELAVILRQEGYVLVSATPQEGAKKKMSINDWLSSLPLLSRVSLTEKLIFTRNLQVMVSSGVSLPRGLKTLAVQTKSNVFKRALESVADQIIKGKSFSDALLEYPKVFSELFQNMVKVAEEAGNLEEVLKILTRQMERVHDLKSKIMGAMMYPIVIIIAMIGIGIGMMIMVVPSLAETFVELGIELPVTTRAIISIGTALANFWYLVPLAIVGLIILARLALKTKTGKAIIDMLFLKIPIISPIIKKTNAAYTVRTLSSLIGSGVPIVKSLRITANALGNVHFKKAIIEAAEKVKKGTSLADSLAPYQNIYPILVIQMLEVGEETGKTSEILEKLADFYEEEVTNTAKNLASVVEPILMIIIGAAVGFFAVSMIQPMYSMLETI